MKKCQNDEQLFRKFKLWKFQRKEQNLCSSLQMSSTTKDLSFESLRKDIKLRVTDKQSLFSMLK